MLLPNASGGAAMLRVAPSIGHAAKSAALPVRTERLLNITELHAIRLAPFRTSKSLMFGGATFVATTQARNPSGSVVSEPLLYQTHRLFHRRFCIEVAGIE